MNRIEFLKEWFYKEEDRKHSLNDSLNIPIGILTAVMVLISYLFNEFNQKNESIYIKFPFLILIIISLFFWVLSVINLLFSYNNFYKGYSYLGFPSTNFLKIDNENFIKYLDDYKEVLDKEITLKSLEEDSFELILTTCLETNVLNNDRKSAYLHKSKINIINCLLALFISTFFFTYNYIGNRKEETQKIEILNLNPKYMKHEKKIIAPPPPQQKPRVIKENMQPKQSPPQKPNKDK